MRGSLGGGDCSSWATACILSAALRIANSGDQIWVEKGVHKPTTDRSNRTASFALKNGVAIYGGFAGTETALSQRNPSVNVTVLSGDIDNNDAVDANGVTTTINGNNSYRVVTANNVNNTTVLDGFVITGGLANGSSPAILSRGGGMFNQNSSPTLTNVTFSGNTAKFGGGMYNFENSSPTLTNVTFSGNTAKFGGGMYN
ncbi:MAG: cadherin, partial [Roseiflexus sp.]